jgi:pyruvate/2-oxoglutarate dehydrogenase complex dihydrolipoamide acyltransferase (E2) component
MRIAERNPFYIKKIAGTAAVTSVGMFGDSPGFGIAFPTVYTVGLVVGSITERVVLEPDGQAVGREHLHLTLSFDHDIIDGGPAARFSADLVARLTSAAVFDEEPTT